MMIYYGFHNHNATFNTFKTDNLIFINDIIIALQTVTYKFSYLKYNQMLRNDRAHKHSNNHIQL